MYGKITVSFPLGGTAKQAMPFLTVDAIIGNQAFQKEDVISAFV